MLGAIPLTSNNMWLMFYLLFKVLSHYISIFVLTPLGVPVVVDIPQYEEPWGGGNWCAWRCGHFISMGRMPGTCWIECWLSGLQN